MDSNARGAVAESTAATWALRKGWIVLFPARGQSPIYDLVMQDGEGKLWKVQVKRAYRRSSEKRLIANLYHGSHTKYTANDIDAFMIVDVDSGALWWLPIDETHDKFHVNLMTPHLEAHRVR